MDIFWPIYWWGVFILFVIGLFVGFLKVMFWSDDREKIDKILESINRPPPGGSGKKIISPPPTLIPLPEKHRIMFEDAKYIAELYKEKR